MTLTDVTETSLFVVLIIFLMLCGISLLMMVPKRRKGRRWGEMAAHPVRFLAIRLGVSFAFGCLFFVIVSAALTLNQHRPPEEAAPVVTVSGSAGRTDVTLDLNECGDPATGTIRVSGIRPGSLAANIESGEDGSQPVKLDMDGVGHFTLSDPSARRSVLSCYVPMPIVEGGSGSSVSITLGEGMEVDTVESVPAPSGYLDGRWTWECPTDERCGILATVGLAVENGAQQVIVLVLAAVFGAIIALLIGEVLIEPIRRRLDRVKESGRP